MTCLRANQRGQSLISLLVGMTVGLIVLGALFGIFISMKTTYRAQTQLTRLAAAEARLMDRLAQVVQMAGFHPYAEFVGVPRPQFVATGRWAQGQEMDGDESGGANGSILRTRFRIKAGEQVTDCGGGTLDVTSATVTYLQMLRVSTGGVLECVVEGEGGGSQRIYALADAVTRFAVRYGTDTDADGSVDRYLDANAVNKSAAWPRVATVRFEVSLAQGLPQGEAPQVLKQIVRVMNRD